MKRGVFTAFFLCMVISFVGCGSEHSFTENGFRLIEEGEYLTARETFNKAVDNGEGDAAYFGRAMATFLGVVELGDYVYTIAGGHPSSEEFSPFSADENLYLYNFLMSLLLKVEGELSAAVEDLNRVVKADDFNVYVQDLPIILGRKETLNLRGYWNRDDVILFRGAVSVILGIVDLILSQDLYADYFSAFEYIKPALLGGGIDPGDPLKCVDVPQMTNLLVYTFSISPELLTVSTNDLDNNGQEDGPEFWQKGYEMLSSGLEDIQTGIKSSISIEQKEDHFFVYDPDTQRMRLALMREENGNYSELTLLVNEEFVAALSAVCQSMQDTSKVLVWDEHIAPLVASLVVSFGNILLSDSSFLSTFFTNPDSYDLIKFAVGSFFDSALAFSPASFFSKPRALRSFLPLWRDDFPDPASFNFAFEWECRAYTGPPGSTDSFPPGSLFCTEGGIADSSHFQDSFFSEHNITPIAPDGITTPAPYMAFQDPSLGGLLLTDVYQLVQRELVPSEALTIDPSEGLKKATNGELNVLIQYVARIAFDLMGDSLLQPSCQ